MKKIFFIANIVLLLFSASYASIKSNDTFDQFILSNKIKQQTAISQDVSVFFSDITYDIPEKQRSNNILAVNDVKDPLEGYNRSMFSFNSFITENIIRPLGILYTFVLPEYMRKGIHRMNDNIEMPGRLINSLLQWRIKRAGIELSRFFVNTTAGAAGFYEVAEPWMGMIPQTNSFGQTFAYWGIKHGCYFVLPIQGGTTLRDGIGLIGDWFADPITWIPPYTFINYISLGIKAGIELNDMTLIIDDYIRIYKASADPYYTLKIVAMGLNRLKQEDQKNDGYEPVKSEDIGKK